MQQAAFQCDNCDQLTPRKKGEKGAPQNWIRLSVQLPGADEKLTGAFHDAECASTWLDEKLGAQTVDLGIVRESALQAGKS